MRSSPYVTEASAAILNDKIGRYPDYPKPGITFLDVSPIMADGHLFDCVIQYMCAPFYRGEPEMTHIAGIESRGFVFGAAMAQALDLGFVPIRKRGAKLPGMLHEESYDLEYGSATLVCQESVFPKGARVLVVDDLLATGGSAGAAARLVQRQGAKVIGFSFVIEIAGLKGAERLCAPSHSVLSFD